MPDRLELDAVPRQVDITAVSISASLQQFARRSSGRMWLQEHSRALGFKQDTLQVGWGRRNKNGPRSFLGGTRLPSGWYVVRSVASGAVDRVPSSRTSESMDDTAVCTSKHLTGLVSSSVVKHAYVQLCWTHRHAKGIVSRFPRAPAPRERGTAMLEYRECMKELWPARRGWRLACMLNGEDDGLRRAFAGCFISSRQSSRQDAKTDYFGRPIVRPPLEADTVQHGRVSHR